MPWTTIDQHHRDLLANAGDPPADIGGALGDPTWLAVLRTWSEEWAQAGGSYTDVNVLAFVGEYTAGRPFDEVWAAFGTEGTDGPIPWRDHFVTLAEGVRGGSQDGQQVLDQMFHESQELLGHAYAQFQADVAELTQHAGANISDPVSQDVTMWDIDWDVVQGINKQVLKDAQEPGTQIPFSQYLGLVLLGPDHAATYYDLITNGGGTQGTVTVIKRGKGLNPGKIQVDGAHDEAEFAARIAEFSKKKCVFGGDDGEDDAGGGMPASPVPDTFADAWDDPQWREVYLVFAEETLIDENTEFLLAVDDYRLDPATHGNELWNRFCMQGARDEINIDSGVRDGIASSYNENDVWEANAYDAAADWVHSMLTNEYTKFTRWVG